MLDFKSFLTLDFRHVRNGEDFCSSCLVIVAVPPYGITSQSVRHNSPTDTVLYR